MAARIGQKLLLENERLQEKIQQLELLHNQAVDEAGVVVGIGSVAWECCWYWKCCWCWGTFVDVCGSVVVWSFVTAGVAIVRIFGLVFDLFSVFFFMDYLYLKMNT